MYNNHLSRLGGRSNKPDGNHTNSSLGRSNPPQSYPYGIDRGTLVRDLKNERPLWIFSSYGPGKNAPVQLFGGPQREQSFEEMRLRHYIAAAQGNPQSAIQEAQALYVEAEKQIQTVLNDPDGAIQYIVRGEKEHPNRYDIVAEMMKNGRTLAQAAQPQQQPTGFGHPATGPTFGQQQNPLNPNPNPNPFAAAAAANVGGGVGFGQPSFGQPSFGQQNPLGQRMNPFGGTSQIPNFGNTSAPPGSQPQQQPTGGAFGQPSQPAFGQPTQPAFGQPTQPAFGQPTQPAFGRPTQPSSNPFSNPTAPPQPAPTGISQQPKAPQGPQGFSQQPQQTQQTQQPKQPQAFIAPNQNPKAPQGETRRDARGLLTLWHGRPVIYITPPNPPSAPGGEEPPALPPYPCYKRADGLLERINFPNGRKLVSQNAVPGTSAAEGQVGQADQSGVEGRPEEYTEAVREAYEYVAREGRFKDGIMPNVPPKREWVSWDF
jgi:nucleoporin NUP42